MERHEFSKAMYGESTRFEAYICARDHLDKGDHVRVVGVGLDGKGGTKSGSFAEDYSPIALRKLIGELYDELIPISVIVYPADKIVDDMREILDRYNRLIESYKSKLAREELMGAVWKYLATIEDASYVDGFAVRDDPNLIVCHLSEEGDLIGFTDDMEDFFRETYGASTIFFPNNCDEEFHKFVKEIMHD